jgi:hypothetical protein
MKLCYRRSQLSELGGNRNEITLKTQRYYSNSNKKLEQKDQKDKIKLGKKELMEKRERMNEEKKDLIEKREKMKQ